MLPVRPDDSATVTLFWHCENEKGVPCVPSTTSLATSAVDIAFLDALSLSLKLNNKKKKESYYYFVLLDVLLIYYMKNTSNARLYQ